MILPADTSSPSGLRILLTRAEEDGRRSAARLSALGHRPLGVPLQTIRRTTEAAPAGPFDAVVVTSAHAVPALRSLRESLSRIPALAVGARTAEALTEAGVTDVRVAAGDAVSLADLARRTLPEGSRLLQVAGRHRKPEPERSLRRAGFELSIWTAYEAAAAQRLPEALAQALRSGEIDAVLHYSRRSAEILIGLTEAAGLADALREPVQVCLSEDVAAPLLAFEARRVIVAAEPSERALFDALSAADMRISASRMKP